MDKDTLVTIIAGTAIGAGVTAAVAARILYKKTIPRQEGTSQDIIDEFADPQKMAEYAATMAPVGEWLEQQELEEVSIYSQDGLKLYAYYIPAAVPSGKVAIIHHGFTSKAKDGAAHAKIFHEMDFDVLLLDLRAHGKSEGEYTGFGILDRYDTMEWVRYCRDRFGRDVRIVLHGVSMGATTVLMALGLPGIQRTVSAVVADCAFTSPYEIFAHVIKKDYHLPPAPILKAAGVIAKKKAGYGFDDYSTVDALQDNRVPVLLIHGKEDLFVPTWMSQKNYEACNCKKELLFVDNAGHGSSVFEDYELYRETEKEFLEAALSAEPEAAEEPEITNEEQYTTTEEGESDEGSES